MNVGGGSVKKKRKISSAGHLDELSNKFFTDMQKIHDTIAPVHLYGMLENDGIVLPKLLCSQSLKDIENWEGFVEKNCVVGADECSSIVRMLEVFALTPAGTVNDSEMCMASIMDSTFNLFVLYCGKNRNRNTTTTTSGLKKPDYSLRKAKSPIFVGEEKLYSNYQKGIYGHDPEKECVDKTPWNRWEDFYGTAPYIIAYTCIADAERIDVNIGLLVKDTQSFFSLFQTDLIQAVNRPVLAGKLLQLLPILAFIHEKSKNSAMALGTIKSNDTIFCSEQTTSFIMNQAKLMLHKKWKFRELTCLTSFFARLSKVKEKLATSDKLMHFTQLSENDVNEVSAYCLPVGSPVLLNTVQDVIKSVIGVAKQVKLLIGLDIVHNDIRWANVVIDNESGECFLIDFDDAQCVNDDGSYDGLQHMSVEEHSSLITSAHGHEVDIWAIGKLLTAAVPTNQKSIQLSSRIMDQCQNMTIDDVLESLAKLVG